MRALSKMAAVSVVGLTSLAAAVLPAQAVSFPEAPQGFTIHRADNASLCVTVERRSTGSSSSQALVLRSCAPGNRAQEFSYQADPGYLHNASMPDDQCVSLSIVGYSLRAVMGPCVQSNPSTVRPVTFTQSPDDRQIRLSNLGLSSKKETCLMAGGEGQAISTQTCADYENEHFIVEPIAR